MKGRRRAPRGVLVLGMHRSGTSAATRLVHGLGPVLCAPGDMVRGPWNPTGHFESRTLMHLDNGLLAQMGCTWWAPPAPGRDYDAALARISTTPAQARRAFRRVHRTEPWVWKDPRATVLVPFWRQVLGPRLAAVAVVRNPLEVAASLQRRHGTTTSFGVALWARYNRLLLEHCDGLPVLVSAYDELVADPDAWSARCHAFLAGLGTDVSVPPRRPPQPSPPAAGEPGVSAGTALAGETPPDAEAATVDPRLRHSVHDRTEVAALFPQVLALLDALDGARGASKHFVAPALGAEPSWVGAELATVGPKVPLAWRPPPGTTATGTEGRA